VVIDRYRKLMFRAARAVTRNDDDADDVVQGTLGAVGGVLYWVLSTCWRQAGPFANGALRTRT
jgi:hypothetical protein